MEVAAPPPAAASDACAVSVAQNGAQHNGAQQPPADDRAVMKEYWAQHSAEATLETMMLDTKARELDAAERPEIMSLLPPSLAGLRVLELGAGIGRFTRALSEAGAASVHAVDFMKNLIEENERVNAGLGNTSFEAADVMTMAFEPGTYDFVFTNWLFMYLSDAELAALAPRLLRCLTPGGRLFFRESCNRQSGDRSRTFNPSHYRSAADYTQLFEGIALPCGARFRLEATGAVRTYVELKGNPNQIFWMWRREG